MEHQMADIVLVIMGIQSLVILPVPDRGLYIISVLLAALAVLQDMCTEQQPKKKVLRGIKYLVRNVGVGQGKSGIAILMLVLPAQQEAISLITALQ